MSANRPETCDFTGLSKDSCHHCNRPTRYELRPGIFEGNRIVEVLKDGGPIHPYDEHFRFGAEKARLLLATLPTIREFARNTLGDGTTTVTSDIVRDNSSGRSIKVWVEMNSQFIHSLGFTVTRPWLRIEVFPLGSGARIGIGVQKAKAISAVAKQLRIWLAQG